MTTLADDPAALGPAAATPLAGVPLEQLRARRAALTEEWARARRWQRLVQARMDLATDAAAPAEELADCRATAVLRALVSGAVVPDLHDDLRDVAAVRRELHAYAAGLRAQLERTTDELVARYAADPASCLGAPAGTADAQRPPR